MKLSKFTYLVFFHFAIFLIFQSKIEAKSCSQNKAIVSIANTQTSSIDSLCSGALGPNLLSIGDFGADTAQVILNDPYITLGYDYQNSPPPDDGFYTITNDISNWGSFAELFWINIGDNSPDTTGYMMVINAHYEPGNFYKEVVEVCENTTYIFSADLINLTKTNVPNFILPSVDFIVNGITVSSVNDIAQDEAWHTSEFSYTTGPGETSLVYLIRNSAPGGFGNDLALDNIFMKTCKGEVDISQHGTLCENGYLQATPYNSPDNFTANYQWQYSIDNGSSWQIIVNSNNEILSLNNQPSNAIYRCLLASGPNNFSLESCYSVSNEVNILFPSIVLATNPTICDDEVYMIDGTPYSTTGVYVNTYTSFFGCDSIVTTNLEVLASSSSEEAIFICEDETYNFQGTIVSETNQYKDTLINAVGCDSIITLDLIVLTNSYYNFEETTCEQTPYFFNDELLSVGGIYKDTLTAYNGCDSFITLQLNVNIAYETFEEETVCFGEYYTFNGVDQYLSGDYTVTLSTINGCDSILNLSLEVLDKKENEINKLICGGQSYTPNNITYTTTGLYTETIATTSGCDSTLTLDLVFEDAIEHSISESICDEEYYFFKNMDLNEQGVYKDTLQNMEGCDSIVTLNLIKYESSDHYSQQDICEDETYQFGGLQLSNPGIYTDTLINQNGCDSILYLELEVYSKFETSLPVSICYGEAFIYDGVSYSQSGTYPIVFNSVNNCDSTILLQLTIEPELSTSIQQSICEGESFEMGGNSYTTSGNYEVMLSASAGCDSTVTLDLLVHTNESTYLEETICDGESYTIGNTSYTENGTYSEALTTIHGCDSTVTLVLDVYQYEQNETLTFCHGENYNGINHDTTITLVATSYLGCDSITNLQLYFFEMDELEIVGDPVFCEGENCVLSVNSYDAYLWSNGVNTAEVEITTPGIYEITVWDTNGCSKTETIEVVMRNLDAEITFQNPTCNNSNAGMIEVEDVFGSGGNYLYSIDGVDFSNSNIFFNLSAGEYNVTIKDELGCEYVREIRLDDPTDHLISIGDDKIIEYGDSTMIATESDTDIRIDSFYWFPEEGLSCLDCMTPMASPLNSTIYTLTIVTDDGCIFQDQIHINVFKPKDVFAPNIFSPNGDGQNDVFTIYAGKMVERIVQVEIYDRWGEHVYSEQPDGIDMIGWDGTFNNLNLEQGVYIYYARIGFVDGDEKIITGDVALVR